MKKKLEVKRDTQDIPDLALSTMQKIIKAHGQGSVMLLAGNEVLDNVETIPTGSYGLDAAIGVGGVPRGRIVEIIGPESSGKTTLCLHIIANAQKQGGVAAFVDAEHALDTTYAQRLGVDPKRLFISQPGCGEEALQIVDEWVRSGSLSVVVVDSVAALTPRAEIDGEMGDHHVGLQARLINQAMRKLASAAHRGNTCVLFTNQIRQKIGVYYGSNETTPGGNALKFYASLRLDIRRIGSVKDGNDHVGSKTKIKVIKNKMAPPFRVCEFEILFNQGIDSIGEMVEAGLATGIITKAGAWYSHGDKKIGQGKDSVREYLRQNPEVLEALAPLAGEQAPDLEVVE